VSGVLLTGLVSGVLLSGAAAAEINDLGQCRQVVKDTEQAIDENPAVEGKSEEILLAVMTLARQRCEEKQFSNAEDLLKLARGMVASE